MNECSTTKTAYDCSLLCTLPDHINYECGKHEQIEDFTVETENIWSVDIVVYAYLPTMGLKLKQPDSSCQFVKSGISWTNIPETEGGAKDLGIKVQ